MQTHRGTRGPHQEKGRVERWRTERVDGSMRATPRFSLQALPQTDFAGEHDRTRLDGQREAPRLRRATRKRSPAALRGKPLSTPREVPEGQARGCERR